jgi:N-acetylmuramic acid 6-phosphate (MurNAc-6-P) etherase
MISTGAMVALGKVRGNLMIDLLAQAAGSRSASGRPAGAVRLRFRAQSA